VSVRYFSFIKYEFLLITYQIYNNGVIRNYAIKLYMSKHFVRMFIIMFNNEVKTLMLVGFCPRLSYILTIHTMPMILIISFNGFYKSFNRLTSVMETQRVYYVARTEILNIIY
jgi:hypothetical protein